MSELATLSSHAAEHRADPTIALVEDLLVAGRIDDASAALDLLLRRDPANPEGWLLQAQLLERQERHADALALSQRAVSLWPDITPAWQLQLRIAQRTGDSALAVRALRHLLADRPDDAGLNSEMGARLSEQGAFDQAIPFLRLAAPILLHENCTIWNYTTALGVTGRYQELIETQPLLDRMAAEHPADPYPPYCHLAAAKLATGLDRGAVVRALDEVHASPDWLDTNALYERLSTIIAQRQPFSLIRLDHALSRFGCYTSLRANLMLGSSELSAIANSVWEEWFGERVETAGAASIARLARTMHDAIDSADVVGLPDPDILRHDDTNLGFLAEMQRLALARDGSTFTSFQYAAALHHAMPFMRPLLQGLPFLAVVGRHAALAPRLGHFCGITETRAIPIPTPADSASPALDSIDQILTELSVPFPGALFLVDLPGPCGIVCCGRIRQQGGIALDIGAVAANWAGR